MNKKKTPKEWLILFAMSFVLGVVFYAFMVKITFKPDFAELFNVCSLILQNLGKPLLKFKAYICVFFLFFPTLATLIMWLMESNKKMEQYGNAEFADLSDEKTWAKMNLSKDKGLMLGCLVKKPLFGKEKRTFIRATQPLSCLVVAPPGTGKTASIALPNLFSIENSCVVLDIKGELFQKTTGYRQKHFKNEILRFSPFSDDNTMFFNPFDNATIKDMNFVQRMKLAEQIASTIFVGEKGKETDHWLVSSKTLFTFFSLYFMQKNNHTDLAQIAQAHKMDYYDYLDDNFVKEAQRQDDDTGKMERNFDIDTFKIWLKQTSNDKNFDEYIRNQARQFNATPDNEFGSIKSTFDTYMKIFANPQVAKAVSKMSFNYEDLREKRISLYVVIDSNDIETLAPLVRILIESIFKYLMTTENSNPDKFVYFILDEFVRFGKMPYLLEAPALCRSYGLIPVYITQSYEQIKKYYGDDDQKIIKANVGYQVVFRMNSPEDAKILSDTIGDLTREKISQSKGNLDLFKRNDSVSNEGYKLITPQDIMSNPADQIYILIGGYFNRPIKAKVNFWFKNPAWQGADKVPLIVDFGESAGNLDDENTQNSAENSNNESADTTNSSVADENLNNESVASESESTASSENTTAENESASDETASSSSAQRSIDESVRDENLKQNTESNKDKANDEKEIKEKQQKQDFVSGFRVKTPTF